MKKIINQIILNSNNNNEKLPLMIFNIILKKLNIKFKNKLN